MHIGVYANKEKRCPIIFCIAAFAIAQVVCKFPVPAVDQFVCDPVPIAFTCRRRLTCAQSLVENRNSACNLRVGSTLRICRKLWRQGCMLMSINMRLNQGCILRSNNLRLNHRGRQQLHQPHRTLLARGHVGLRHGCRVRAIDDVLRVDIFAEPVLVRVRQTDHALTLAHRFEKWLRPRRVHVQPFAIAHRCLPHGMAREDELD